MPTKTNIKVEITFIINIIATNGIGQKCYFKDTLIFLVEDPNWTEILIGRPTFKRKGLLLSQNFEKSNEQTSTEGIQFIKSTTKNERNECSLENRKDFSVRELPDYLNLFSMTPSDRQEKSSKLKVSGGSVNKREA